MKTIPEIPILHEDNHLLVVVKPINVLSQEDDTGDPDMLTVLKADLKRRHDKPGNVFLGLVHRLDRPVGGAMVFAKTSKAASRLSEQIRDREFGKTYLAVVHGAPDPLQGTLQHYLKKDPKTNKVKAQEKPIGGEKPAILRYQIIGHDKSLSLVRIELVTGKPHQIRAQFAAIGHPLFGDKKYGRERTKPGEQMALWSHTLKFKHPTQDEELTFTSTPPNQYPWILFSF